MDILYNVTVRSRQRLPKELENDTTYGVYMIGVMASSPTEAMKRVELLGYEALSVDEEQDIPKRD